MTSHQHHTHQILTELESGKDLSQRALSQQLGIALGLTNLLVRRVISKGWVRVVHLRANRVRYLLTPTGIAEKGRMTRAYLNRSLSFYAEARDRIRERFATLSATGPFNGSGSPNAPADKRIVFFGAGEVAEVGYICLRGTDLHLVAVVDDKATSFFDLPVYRRTQLGLRDVGGLPYDCVVVMSFVDVKKIQPRLDRLGIPRERVFWP